MQNATHHAAKAQKGTGVLVVANAQRRHQRIPPRAPETFRNLKRRTLRRNDLLSLIARVVHRHKDTGQQCDDHHRHHSLGVDRVAYMGLSLGDFVRRIKERIVRFVQRIQLFKWPALVEERFNFV